MKIIESLLLYHPVKENYIHNLSGVWVRGHRKIFD